MIRAFLYDAEGHDREVSLTDEGLGGLASHQLLWIDQTGREPEEIERLGALLKLGPDSVTDLAKGARTFGLANYGDYFQLDVASVDSKTAADGVLKLARSVRLDLVVGPGWLLTVHEKELGFLEAFRDQDRGETLIGALTSPTLAASLLDRHLAAYLGSFEEVETFVDKVDVRMLSRSSVREDLLNELVGARRYLSGLRRSLAPQRAIFYGLSRPDFALVANSESAAAYTDLERRFERALDSIEHGRELIQSSFDLFTTRTAETTNVLIRRLTFLSLLLGALGGVAGVFGMNFETSYQKAGMVGFWSVVGGFFALTVVATVVGKLRKWI